LSTILYSADGVVLAEFSGERRIWVPISKVPQSVKDALISAEDKSFYKHWGLDSWGILRAVVKNITKGGIRQGGSSITQQLARVLFLGTEKTLVRKIKEALTAIKIERKYSKDEILELYLNQNFLGRGNYGVEAASKYYFNKHIWEVNPVEAALIAGLLKAPESYNPIKHPDRAKRRRNIVIDAMVDARKIDRKTADSLKALPVDLAPERGIYLKAPYFSEFVRQYLENKYGEEKLYSGGLRVYTTLDWNLQCVAESLLVYNVSRLQRWIQKIHHKTDTSYTIVVYDSAKGDTVREWKKLQGAFLAIETSTGAIKALVGGTNFWESQFNRAVQAQRQAGSAFKPFVYTTAIDNGYKPSDLIEDLPLTERLPNGTIWRPQNYDDEYLGPITLRKALYRSRNLATLRL
ncbi:MAG: transglycosylase domain-containing protein, partial [bacterium]